MQTEIFNFTKHKIPQRAIVEKCQNFLATKKIGNVQFAIHLVTAEKIRTLNKKFLTHDKITDVLSFSQFKNLNEIKNAKLSTRSLGDIFICYQVASKHAKQYNKTTKEELLFLVEHGLRHLIGIHHK